MITHLGRKIGFGVLLWAVPYALSIPLLPLMKSDPLVFKAVMISAAAIVSAALTVFYFKKITEHYLREAVLLAGTWVVVNWLLDAVALIPFSGHTVPRYFMEIGIEYIALMAPVIALGYLLDEKLSTKNQRQGGSLS